MFNAKEETLGQHPYAAVYKIIMMMIYLSIVPVYFPNYFSDASNPYAITFDTSLAWAGVNKRVQVA